MEQTFDLDDQCLTCGRRVGAHSAAGMGACLEKMA